MDLNKMNARAIPDSDVANEFPMNVFFALINDYKKFCSTHLNPLRLLFPQILENGKILPLNILCMCSHETLENIHNAADSELFSI